MGSPFQGNQGSNGVPYGDEYYPLFMPLIPQTGIYTRTPSQDNSGYTQNLRSDSLICDLPSWTGLSGTSNDPNSYPGGDQMLSEVSFHVI
jgi:hypothetical protein